MDGFGTLQSFLFGRQKKRCVYVGVFSFFLVLASGVDLHGAPLAWYGENSLKTSAGRNMEKKHDEFNSMEVYFEYVK